MYKIEKIKDRIFLLVFDNKYDSAMHFWRYQEYYESPKYRGQMVTLVDYMEDYAKNKKLGGDAGKGTFRYPGFWTGFNIPGQIIFNVHKEGILDPNKYDAAMMSIYTEISNSLMGDDFYLIGVYQNKKRKVKESLLHHEIAHGLFYTNKEYRDTMIHAVQRLPKKVKVVIFDVLKDMGYDISVYVDEAQAYMATDLDDEFDKYRRLLKKYQKKFDKILKKFL